MGLKDFFNSVFEESEEELLADIKDAEELIRERKSQLEELKKGRQRRAPQPKPRRKSRYSDYVYFIIPIIIAVIIIVIGLSLSYSDGGKKSMYCEGDEECPDCEIVLSCADFTSDRLEFRLTNQLNAAGECIVDIVFSQNETLVSKKTYALGSIRPRETIKTSIPIDMPEGNTDISVLPTCEW